MAEIAEYFISQFQNLTEREEKDGRSKDKRRWTKRGQASIEKERASIDKFWYKPNNPNVKKK